MVIIGVLIVLAIVLGLIAGLLYLIALILPWVLGAGAVVGLLFGIYYAINNYWSSIKENIDNKVFKITMMFITSVFIVGLLGVGLYAIPVIVENFTTFNRPNVSSTSAPQETWTNRIVNADRLNVRSGPSANHAVLFSLPRNTVVRVSNLGRSGDWVRISHNNRIGFVNQNFLISETWANRTVNTNGLNVRSGPSANHAVLFTLPQNTVVRVSNLGRSGDWVRINHNNRTGYVNQRFLR